MKKIEKQDILIAILEWLYTNNDEYGSAMGIAGHLHL